MRHTLVPPPSPRARPRRHGRVFAAATAAGLLAALGTGREMVTAVRSLLAGEE